VTGQRFTQVKTCYRIGDPNGSYPILSDVGATRADGRWHTKAFPLIYTCEHFSTSMLETLAHHSGKPPANQHYVKVTLPPGISYEVFDTTTIPDWYRIGNTQTPLFGSRWVTERRSLILIVPSAVAHVEDNFLINAAHPEFSQLSQEIHRPVYWDNRLFRTASVATRDSSPF